MPCDNKQIQTTRRKDKDGDVITTHTSKRVCANDADDIKEYDGDEAREIEAEQPQVKSLIEDFEELVYPPSIKAQPEVVEIVVRDSRTGEKYLRKVPAWALEQRLDPEQIKLALAPVNPIKEVFDRYMNR